MYVVEVFSKKKQTDLPTLCCCVEKQYNIFPFPWILNFLNFFFKLFCCCCVSECAPVFSQTYRDRADWNREAVRRGAAGYHRGTAKSSLTLFNCIMSIVYVHIIFDCNNIYRTSLFKDKVGYGNDSVTARWHPITLHSTTLGLFCRAGQLRAQPPHPILPGEQKGRALWQPARNLWIPQQVGYNAVCVYRAAVCVCVLWSSSDVALQQWNKRNWRSKTEWLTGNDKLQLHLD